MLRQLLFQKAAYLFSVLPVAITAGEEVAELHAAKVGYGDPHVLVDFVWVARRDTSLRRKCELGNCIRIHLLRVGREVRIRSNLLFGLWLFLRFVRLLFDVRLRVASLLGLRFILVLSMTVEIVVGLDRSIHAKDLALHAYVHDIHVDVDRVISVVCLGGSIVTLLVCIHVILLFRCLREGLFVLSVVVHGQRRVRSSFLQHFVKTHQFRFVVPISTQLSVYLLALFVEKVLLCLVLLVVVCYLVALRCQVVFYLFVIRRRNLLLHSLRDIAASRKALLTVL